MIQTDVFSYQLRNPGRLRGSQPSVQKKSKFFLNVLLHLKTSYTVKRHEEKPRFFELWQNRFL